MIAPSLAPAKPSRGLNIALWIVQGICAAMFLFAGWSKFAGPPEMVQTFELIGFGQWFRYLTGTLEAMGGLALPRPGTAVFGAILLACVMVGAILTHLFLIPGSALPAFVLLLLCLFIAWGRRASLPTVFSR
jgi:putative oxidoreductase